MSERLKLTRQVLKQICEQNGIKITVRKVKLFKDGSTYIVPVNRHKGISFISKERMADRLDWYLQCKSEGYKHIKESAIPKYEREIERAGKLPEVEIGEQIYMPDYVVSFWEYKNGKLATFLGVVKEEKPVEWAVIQQEVIA